MMTPDTCGNCKYGVQINDAQLECHGDPPHATVVPGKDNHNRPAVCVEFFWPLVLPHSRACHLWQLRLVSINDTSRGSA